LSVSLLIENGYDNINAFLHRGIIYSETERFDEAIKDFESALDLDKEFAPAYCNLGIIYMNVHMNYWKYI
jgi:tetratricopeptide (TPR) repeat protein